MIANTLFLLLFFILKVLVSTQTTQPTTHKDLKLDIEETGIIDQDMGTFFYKLLIPANTLPNKTNLVIRIKENDLADEGKDFFSDPDIYVSKTVMFPLSPESSRWYSERYGEDLLSIPKTEVSSGEVFYVGVFCEKKCKYSLLSKLEEEHEIFEGTVYKTFIKKKESLSFRFRVDKTDYNELEIIAYSPHIGNFRIYVDKNETPSFQKTILAIPSWVGGYSVNILKGSQDYCTNCYYYIVLDAPLMDANVFLFVKYEDTVTLMRSTEPVFSTLKPYKQHCYKFRIPENKKNDNVLIQLMLFSGSIVLKTRPWNIPDNSGDSNNYYIHSEKVIKISPEDRKRNNTETGELYYCLSTSEYTSYILKSFFESEIEHAQKFSFLYRGKEIEGYLPANKATRYRILEFDTNANITVTMNVKSGNLKLYGYVCENIRECRFNRERIDKELKNGKLILSQEYSMVYTMTIENKDNICHQKLSKEDSIQNEMNNIPCASLAVIMCEGPSDCEYSIRTSRDNYSISLKPKKVHYQILPYDERDYYQISINDENISDLNIVLNSITGDADLTVNYTEFKLGGKNENRTIAISENEPYLPDVIRINNVTLGKSNIIGLYNIAVYGSSFSSYSIYYYTTYLNTDHNKPVVSDTTIELQAGHIVKDFLLPDTKYKIYAFNPILTPNSDIIITITPERSRYSLHVFNDLSKFVYNDTEIIYKIQNAKWNSLYNDELIIRKTDREYQKGSTYYIVVARLFDSEDSNTTTHNPHIPSYWIGATTEKYPFLLYEGVPHSSLLDDSYSNQTYWYTHSDVKDAFHLSLNVYYGHVDVYADFGEIKDLNSNEIPLKALAVDTGYYSISPEKLKSGCKSEKNCGIYILVRKNSTYDSQYLLVAKSHVDKPVILTSGTVRSDSMSAGENRRYNMIVEKKKSTVIFVSFLSGYGEVYVNVPKAYQDVNKAIYPTKDKYDFKSTDSYIGKQVSLSGSQFDQCDPCQVLVSVYGSDLDFSNDQIEYTVAYYDSKRKINQNQPVRGYITQGEIQYFNVFFGKKVDNIYVSLTNMDGDVDMYMDYGNTYPTMDNSTWFSATPYNEFIEFNKDDNYFLTRKIQDISGSYTITLYGFTNSSYTLYLTSHPKKIIPLDQGIPASCKAKAGESCYFRFENFDDFLNSNQSEYDFIVVTDYLIGSGNIYAKLYNYTDYDIIEKFPCAKENDYNNINTNSRNLLEFKVESNNIKLNKDSMILITIECKENCFFDLNIIRQIDSGVKYLDLYRENIFYIYKKPENRKSRMIFYNYLDRNITYSVYSYVGQADFVVYTNDTLYNGTSSNSQVKEINKFSIDYLYKPTYQNFIDTKFQNIGNKNIFFSIEPKSDVGFYIKLAYDREWTKLKINKVNSLLVNSYKKIFNGFFDMLDDYENAIVTLTSKNPSIVAYVYIRYHIVEKDKKTNDNTGTNPYGYIVPDSINSEINGQTDPILSSVSVKIPKLTRDKIEGRFTRVLISVQTVSLSYNNTDTTEMPIEILISPVVKGYGNVKAEQNKFIFTEFYGLGLDLSRKEKRTFDLQKKNPKDDLMVLEISTCVGDVDYTISDTLDEQSKNIEHTVSNSGGKYLMKIDLKNYRGNNFYLTLKQKSGLLPDCGFKNLTFTCENKISTMLYYFTTSADKFFTSFSNSRGALQIAGISSDSVVIEWPKILTIDENYAVNKTMANYTVFVSDNVYDYNHMESICYLSKMKQNNANVLISFTDDTVIATIRNLKSDDKYFVNVLAKNLDTNEVIAFKPLEIIPGGSFPYFLFGLISILVILFAVLAYFFYRKYVITREILKYETNDIRNMSQIPKTENELKNLAMVAGNQKYANLSERSDEI